MGFPVLTFRLRGFSPLLVLALGATVFAQTSPPPDPPVQQKEPPREQRPVQKPGELKPYKDVVTDEAKSQEGLFTVHRIGEKVLFEIPASTLGKEMLWATEVAQTPVGGFGGTQVGDKVVRWTRRGNKVYLRLANHSVRAATGGAIKAAVEAASLEPILAAFDVEAEGNEAAAVIDLSKFLVSDPAEFSIKRVVSGASVDAARSYIDSVKAFPTNIEMRSMLTFNSAPPAAGTGRVFGGGGGSNASSASALAHYSMVLLPEEPMKPRLLDSRVGFFGKSFSEFGAPENRVMNRSYISRFRLKKKDPAAAMSEPVKPIVFYISREVPEKWRPHLKKGVESWS